MDTSQIFSNLINRDGLGIVIKEGVSQARDLATSLMEALNPEFSRSWVCSTVELDKMTVFQPVPLIITIGGDGTILRTVRLAAPAAIPILGINMGGVGYLTEVDSGDPVNDLPHLLVQIPRIEERDMLEIKIHDTEQLSQPMISMFGLNEVVIARSGLARLTVIDLTIDNFDCGRIRSDGIVVATSTGSTAYAHSLGGPVIHPESSDLLLLVPAMQMHRMNPIVIKANSIIQAKPIGNYSVAVSVDGFIDHALKPNEYALVSNSLRKAKFLRYTNTHSFYRRLWKAP